MNDAAPALDRHDDVAVHAPALEIDLDAVLPTTQVQKLVDLYPREQVMKAFDIRSPNKLYDMIDNGDLEAKYCGGRLLVTGASIRRYIANMPSHGLRPRPKLRSDDQQRQVAAE